MVKNSENSNELNNSRLNERKDMGHRYLKNGRLRLKWQTKMDDFIDKCSSQLDRCLSATHNPQKMDDWDWSGKLKCEDEKQPKDLYILISAVHNPHFQVAECGMKLSTKEKLLNFRNPQSTTVCKLRVADKQYCN